MAEPRRAQLNDTIQDALLAGATAELDAAGVGYDILSVPGSLEIPAAVSIALDAAKKNGRPYDGAIALGCVIRGETFHFEIVSMESARGLTDIAVARSLPLGNGIITVNTEAQAWARARADGQNKGGDAARAALAMIRIKRRLAKP
jgi:6,7-dimethyl-8-ribityllumazine synthase